MTKDEIEQAREDWTTKPHVWGRKGDPRTFMNNKEIEQTKALINTPDTAENLEPLVPTFPTEERQPNTVCDRCQLKIRGQVYPCMECKKPFHRACLFRHCNKAQMSNEAYLDALKEEILPDCMEACESGYFGNSHHPDCPRAFIESERECE